jgi:hypothetical protein
MTEPVCAFEHPETDTLVRRAENERVVQIIRAGRELARYPMHVNSPTSCAPNGSVYFNPGRGALNHLPTASRCSPTTWTVSPTRIP